MMEQPLPNLTQLLNDNALPMHIFSNTDKEEETSSLPAIETAVPNRQNCRHDMELPTWR
jgi:hypothetical protein